MSFQRVVINEPGSVGPDFVASPDTGTGLKQPESEKLNTRDPGQASAEALRVLDLTKSFRSGFLRRPIRGIDGVSFTVPRGHLFALLGHNGAGKTTTINCILDLVHPDRGQVSILGRPHGDLAVRARVGYLPERPYFFEHLTGRELLRFYAKLLGVETRLRDPRIESLVARLGRDWGQRSGD